MKKHEKNRKFYRLSVLILIVLTALFLLASCSKANNKQDNFSSTEIAGGSASGSNYPTDGGTKEPSQDSVNKTPYEIKIVRTANIEAQTLDYEKAIQEIEKAVSDCNGLIASSRITGKNPNATKGYSYRSANYTFKIPAGELDRFLNTTGDLVNVLSQTTTESDITSQYYDTVSRLEVLRTEKEMLEKMLAASTTVEQMLSIETRLYNVIEEIEAYQTKLNVYDSQVSYSTVEFVLHEVSDLTKTLDNPSFGQRISKAFSDSWEGFASFCKDLAVFFVYALPALIVLTCIAVVVILIVRRSVKKKKAKKEQL